MGAGTLCVITPTLRRPHEVRGLLETLCAQTHLPTELILVDGSQPDEDQTERLVAEQAPGLPFAVHHVRAAGGTAAQRNAGIDRARGELIAFIDDDIRLASDFFAHIVQSFADDRHRLVGGITGYIINQHIDPMRSSRWRWYRRLRLFSTYEPGRFDFQSGYPISRYLEPPHEQLRSIDFMGAGCAVWRSEVFANGLRFSPFFQGYGMLEDVHLSLRAGRTWKLLENGRAHCTHLMSQTAREPVRAWSRKTAVNFRYVFLDLVPDRTWRHELRFWRVQFVDLLRYVAGTVMEPRREHFLITLGKIEGMAQAALMKPGGLHPHR